MPPILNSISRRIFFTLGILVFNIGVIALLSLLFLMKTRAVGSIGQHIDSQRILIIKLIKTDLGILRFESVNQEFYETGIIMKNLISNSFRYIDPLKSENYVVIEGQVNEQQLTLKITDNGIGIEEKHMPRIYDMFYRAVEHSQGTGIGLFLVRETVRMLRGKIAVKSKLAEWTIFYLTIPNLKGNTAIIESAETAAEAAVVVGAADQSVV